LLLVEGLNGRSDPPLSPVLRARAYLHLVDNTASSVVRMAGGDYSLHERLVRHTWGLAAWNALLQTVCDALVGGAATEPDPIAAVGAYVRGHLPVTYQQV